MNHAVDWLCYQFVMWFPVWRVDPRGRFYGDHILPRAGRYAYRN